MCVCLDVDSSHDPRKRSFKTNTEPYHAVGNDEKNNCNINFFTTFRNKVVA